MKMKPSHVALFALVCVLLPAGASAQSGVKQLEANKKLVLDFFRVVFQAENVAAAKDYLPENYIQHNPLVAQGRDGFTNYFKTIWKQPKPVRPTLDNPPAAIIAEGDLVTVMWKEPRPDPEDRSKTYDSYWFDLFRVKNGKLVEHWDNAVKE
jgi:predicted SnoaL-like aldol condensation-catalyzing enzyme